LLNVNYTPASVGYIRGERRSAAVYVVSWIIRCMWNS
jgi:hypothetical protein